MDLVVLSVRDRKLARVALGEANHKRPTVLILQQRVTVFLVDESIDDAAKDQIRSAQHGCHLSHMHAHTYPLTQKGKNF